MCKKWGNDLPPWRYAILVGQAKRLALNPPDSAWGRSMLAKRGGKAVQIDYRLAGRNPTANATAARRKKPEPPPKLQSAERRIFSLSPEIMPVERRRK
jgi:hypothetical protein